MKLKFIYALAIAGVLSTFTSCSDDDPAPGSSLEQKTYSSDNLTLNFNGAPLIGKTVTFTPGTDGKGTVTLAGESLNPSQILDMITRAAADDQPTRTIPTAGVLPGSPSVSIPVELKGDANNCTFEGTNETEYCTYSYSGSVTADNFEFNLSDVKLKNTSLAGTWTVPAVENNFFNTARVQWKGENTKVDIELVPGFSLPLSIQSTIQLALSVYPMFYPNENGEPTLTPLEMLCFVLKSVTFGEDGSLTAEYIDTKNENMPIVTAPIGLAQYVIDGEGSIRLFLNPAAIIANSIANTKTRAVDLNILVEGLMQNLMPMLSQGIPLHYGPAIASEDPKYGEDGTSIVEGSQLTYSEDTLSFYLDTNTLLPLIKAFLPILQDQDFVDQIIEAASKDPAMGSQAHMLRGILKDLPSIIENTTLLEIGINLKK